MRLWAPGIGIPRWAEHPWGRQGRFSRLAGVVILSKAVVLCLDGSGLGPAGGRMVEKKKEVSQSLQALILYKRKENK